MALGAAQLAEVVELSKLVASALEPATVLDAVLDFAIAHTSAKRGQVIEIDAEGALRLVRTRNFRRGAPTGAVLGFCSTPVKWVIDRGETLLVPLAAIHEVTYGSRSRQALEAWTLLVAPLVAGGVKRGAVILHNRLSDEPFSAEHAEILEAVAPLAAVVLAFAWERAELARMGERLAEDMARSETERTRILRKAPGKDAALSRRARFPEIVGASAAHEALLETIERCAATERTVLVTGESGTGKELVARAIHEHGARARRPFVAENLRAVPEALFESTLFGHVRGAFTGADRDQDGLVALAEGGTLFLDEIGELSAVCQAKLLRFLETRRYRKVGGVREERADVRIVTATNRDLRLRMEEGEFREDLYYRLRVLEVAAPPLRARGTDAMLLALHFLEKHAKDGRSPRLAPDAVARIECHPWPGNVRELEHAIERAVALTGGDGAIEARHLQLDDRPIDLARSSADLLSLENAEKETAITALLTLPTAAAAAKSLGIDRTTLWRKMKEWGISRRDIQARKPGGRRRSS